MSMSRCELGDQILGYVWVLQWDQVLDQQCGQAWVLELDQVWVLEWGQAWDKVWVLERGVGSGTRSWISTSDVGAAMVAG
jgi:hypothetical protein